ncbi:MAG TPA: PilZ domain-containing protein [Anaerolineales bacterium]|nr:PilZ domain-containing protein [Anaerolineales bacterium]HNE04854.1 PilZ domain-containing protein [Anaerolineales bacterium]HNO93053.1 PilZ domain-containing protein [Anaerolineales bacterium]
MANEKRKLPRRNFSYYMRVLKKDTGELIGQIIDISTGGFKLESSKPLPSNVQMELCIDQVNQISPRSYIVFSARTRWCDRDPYDPTIYNVGFQLVDMTPADYDVFVTMFNTYGEKKQAHHKTNTDYIWG